MIFFAPARNVHKRWIFEAFDEIPWPYYGFGQILEVNFSDFFCPCKERPQEVDLPSFWRHDPPLARFGTEVLSPV